MSQSVAEFIIFVSDLKIEIQLRLWRTQCSQIYIVKNKLRGEI